MMNNNAPYSVTIIHTRDGRTRMVCYPPFSQVKIEGFIEMSEWNASHLSNVLSMGLNDIMDKKIIEELFKLFAIES